MIGESIEIASPEDPCFIVLFFAGQKELRPRKFESV
jgi:hypothetical protein